MNTWFEAEYYIAEKEQERQRAQRQRRAVPAKRSHSRLARKLDRWLR